MNKFIAIGNLVRDPELVTAGQSQKVRFSIAINGVPFTNGAGEKVQKTTFVDCEGWGKTADFIHNYFTKGAPILIEDGELMQDIWEDKTSGQRRSKHYVRVNRVAFLPRNSGEDTSQQSSESPAAPKAATKKRGRSPKPAVVEEEAIATTEDIPF